MKGLLFSGASGAAAGMARRSGRFSVDGCGAMPQEIDHIASEFS
jgi:hypothetical protein